MVPVLGGFVGVGLGLWLMRRERFTWISILAIIPSISYFLFRKGTPLETYDRIGEAVHPGATTMLLLGLIVYGRAIIKLVGRERLAEGTRFAAISYGISLALYVVGAKWLVDHTSVTAGDLQTWGLVVAPPLLAFAALLVTRPDRQEARDG